MPVKSRYVLLLEGLSSVTRSGDIKHEFEACGTVKEVERDAKSRSALIEMKRSSDAEYAWKKMDGLRIDGKKWKVEYAIRDDFKYFGWKWTEGGDSPTPSPPRYVVDIHQAVSQFMKLAQCLSSIVLHVAAHL
ncbi:TPA: hypothetical protein ACH3X2_009949 [Trebouxia sp. C0005]